MLPGGNSAQISGMVDVEFLLLVPALLTGEIGVGKDLEPFPLPARISHFVMVVRHI